MDNLIIFLKTDNFLIIFAVLIVILLIGFLILIIRVSNLNKRYIDFMKKIGNGKNIEEDLENYIYRVEKVEKQNADLQLIFKDFEKLGQPLVEVDSLFSVQSKCQKEVIFYSQEIRKRIQTVSSGTADARR